MLGTGLLLYMLSKEIYVINHETFAAASIGAVIIYGVKKFGPGVAAFADKLNEVGRQPFGFVFSCLLNKMCKNLISSWVLYFCFCYDLLISNFSLLCC